MHVKTSPLYAAMSMDAPMPRNIAHVHAKPVLGQQKLNIARIAMSVTPVQDFTLTTPAMEQVKVCSAPKISARIRSSFSILDSSIKRTRGTGKENCTGLGTRNPAHLMSLNYQTAIS